MGGAIVGIIAAPVAILRFVLQGGKRAARLDKYKQSSSSFQNMSETFAIVGFALLMAMVATWFVLISWLFRRLRERHASTYEAMGSPTLFWNNSIRNNWLFMKFLFSSEWRGLRDPAVANVCRFMRIFIVVYFLFFLGFVAFTFHNGPR